MCFAVAMCPLLSMRWMIAGGGHHESRRERHTLGKVAIHGGAGDSQHFRDVAGRDALLPELTGFGGIGVVDLAWPSALAPVGCCSGPRGTPARRQAIGRPKALDISKAALAQRMHASGESARTIAATLGVSRATIYRVLSDHNGHD
jgi:Helix-turn-helix domain of resolvase